MLVPETSFKPDMHNIRPAEAFNLAHEGPNFVYFDCFFDKNTLWMFNNLLLLALGYVKKMLARHEIWVVHPWFNLLLSF